jgi:hypothetical protein
VRVIGWVPGGIVEKITALPLPASWPVIERDSVYDEIGLRGGETLLKTLL